MAPSFFITGPSLGIRSLEQSDAELVHGWINDPVVNAFATMAVLPRSSDSVERMVADLLKSDSAKGLMVEHLGQGPIALVQLRHINWKDRNAELSGLIGQPELWGQGLGTEGLSLLCALTFEALGLHRVYCYAVEFNERSSRLLQKTGFVKEGTLRQSFFAGARFYDAVLYSLLCHEYPNEVVQGVLNRSVLPWHSLR